MHLSRRLVPWTLLAALQLGDIITTAIALNTRAAIEANRSARDLMNSYGQLGAYTIKAICVAGLIYLLWRYRHRRWATIALYTGLALSAYAVINNTGFLLSSHQ